MKINLKNPIVSSLFGIAITFIVFLIILCVTKPSYIMEVSKKGKKKKSIYLSFIYSLLFSTLTGIIILLTVSKEIDGPLLSFNSRSFNPRTYSPR